MPGEVFVDTGAWVAISDADDHYHATAAEFYMRALRHYRALVTTNLVIAETYVLIRRRSGHQPAIRFLDSVHRSRRILKIYSNESLEEQAEDILRRYSDQDFSLTDAVSFAVMGQRSISEAFAFDRHFLAAGFTLLPAPSP